MAWLIIPNEFLMKSFPCVQLISRYFVHYDNEYSEIIKHIKMDDAFNYALYNQLHSSLKYMQYELRSQNSGFITNIGSYDRQYPYRETEFPIFDQFLFATWDRKPNGKGKNEIPWGVNTNMI